MIGSDRQVPGPTPRASGRWLAAGGVLGIATTMLAPAAEATNEIVTGVVTCAATAPRQATMNGTNGILEGELICSGRPAGGDCTDRLRSDLDDQGCKLARDSGGVGGDTTLYFACSGRRRDMIDVIDTVCRRLLGGS